MASAKIHRNDADTTPGFAAEIGSGFIVDIKNYIFA